MSLDIFFSIPQPEPEPGCFDHHKIAEEIAKTSLCNLHDRSLRLFGI